MHGEGFGTSGALLLFLSLAELGNEAVSGWVYRCRATQRWKAALNLLVERKSVRHLNQNEWGNGISICGRSVSSRLSSNKLGLLQSSVPACGTSACRCGVDGQAPENYERMGSGEPVPREL